MARPFGAIVEFVHRVAVTGSRVEADDAALVERFACNRDESAFEALVRRHGPLVFGICRRVIGHEQDAEDAFQATFLLLARNAKSIRRHPCVAAWLHRVAWRVALRARSHAARNPITSPLTDVAVNRGISDIDRSDLRRVLDEEIDRLPKIYRLPFILCCVQGTTNQEAASHLGCAVGTIAARLTRARARLRRALQRRGISLSAGVPILIPESVSPWVPVSLTRLTVRAALAGACKRGLIASGISPKVGLLAREVQTAMLISKLKVGAGLFIGLLLVGAGASVVRSSAQVVPGQRGPLGLAAIPSAVPAPLTAGSQAAAEPTGVPVFEPAPGCRWLLSPADQRRFGRDFDGSEICFVGSRQPLAIVHEIDSTGAFTFFEAYVGPMRRGLGEYRPVAFDRVGKRYPFEFSGGCSGGMDAQKASMVRYRLDPKRLPADQVAYLGVEEITVAAPR